MADRIAHESHATKDYEATDQSASSGYEKSHEDDPKGIVAEFGPRLDENGVPIEVWKEAFAHLIRLNVES